MSHCRTTGKVRYRDKLGAQIALASIASKGHSSKRREAQIYRCPNCRGWHLRGDRL